MKKNFETIEEEDVIIHDESDDYDPGEDEINEENEFRLMTNEEIFTDEYMQIYSEKMDAQIAKDKRTDRLVSVGVVVGSLLFIGLITYLKFRNV